MNNDSVPFLKAENVSHIYPDGLKAIDNISLSIQKGSFIVLVGASGTGKSTLLRILGGLLQSTDGHVALNGLAPNLAADPIGIVFQRDNLMPWRTTWDNIRLPLELQGEEPARSEQRVAQLIDLVGLAGFERSYPAQLSGGMAQRVALARGLLHAPSLLLLDEPFGALDALTRERMGRELLRIWRAMPVTVFMVTHSIPEAVLLADQVFVMNGRPGTIRTQIHIDIPRPRRQEQQASSAFQNYAAAIRASIESG